MIGFLEMIGMPFYPQTFWGSATSHNRYTQRELIAELEDLGFAGTFDFLYSPLDKGTMSNVGYAFVNFKTHEDASKCIAAFHNYRFKRR